MTLRLGLRLQSVPQHRSHNAPSPSLLVESLIDQFRNGRLEDDAGLVETKASDRHFPGCSSGIYRSALNLSLRRHTIASDAQYEFNSSTEMHRDETICFGVVRDAQTAQLWSPIRSLFDKHRERAKQTSHHGRNAVLVASDLLFCSLLHSVSILTLHRKLLGWQAQEQQR